MAKQETKEVVTQGPSKKMRLKSLATVIVIFAMLIYVLGNLVKLMIVETEDWQKRAVGQQLKDNTISANRGTIFDADMKVLAQSYGVYTVVMAPCNLQDTTDSKGATVNNEPLRQKVADDLSEMLSIDRDKLYEQTQKSNSAYAIVKAKIELEDAQKVTEWVNENKLAGTFRIIEDYKRIYPMNTLLSSTLGFVGTDGQGLYGIEATYDEVLAGTAGRVMSVTNGVGGEMPTSLKYEKTVDAENGGGVVLTVRSSIQAVAEKHLEQAVIDKQCTNRGLIIVMDVKTGAILAQACKGDFDPNEPMSITNESALSQIAELAGDEQSVALKTAREKQWVNKVVSDFYEPGSVFKVFTASMALEEGLITKNTYVNCPGFIHVADRQMNCWVYPRNHGSQTFALALSNSCNPVFMNLGLKIGGTNFLKYYASFGFTEKTGIDLIGEGRVNSSLYHTADTLGPVELASSSIGQTFKITPIQMITAMSAVANGGYLMQPYIVSQILDADGNVVKTTMPTVKRQVISEATSKTMAEMMAGAVNGGGARNAYVAGYRVAGKTGTSEYTETRGTDNVEVWGSFSGFAPADDPQVAVLVVMDSPQSSSRYGGTVAAPVAQKVLAEVLPYLGIDPQYTQEELAGLNTATPSLINKSVATAQSVLTEKGLTCNVVGNGDTVIRQMPEAGKSIPKGGSVVIYTENTGVTGETTVPDFHGMSVSAANRAASTAKINLIVNGLSSGAGEARADTQSVAAGTTVAPGTVVTVNFIYDDHIA